MLLLPTCWNISFLFFSFLFFFFFLLSSCVTLTHHNFVNLVREIAYQNIHFHIISTILWTVWPFWWLNCSGNRLDELREIRHIIFFFFLRTSNTLSIIALVMWELVFLFWLFYKRVSRGLKKLNFRTNSQIQKVMMLCMLTVGQLLYAVSSLDKENLKQTWLGTNWNPAKYPSLWFKGS